MLMELMYRFLFYNSKIQLVILILLDSGGLILISFVYTYDGTTVTVYKRWCKE